MQVTKIGVCGQMHGIALWKTEKKLDQSDNTFKLEFNKENISHLYTWQDGRCDINFLNTLPKSKSHLPVHTGYGCATLFWFAKHKYYQYCDK